MCDTTAVCHGINVLLYSQDFSVGLTNLDIHPPTPFFFVVVICGAKLVHCNNLVAMCNWPHRNVAIKELLKKMKGVERQRDRKT